MQEKLKVYWCSTCRTPILTNEKGCKCSLCGSKTRYMCADMRPVFSEERLLVEVLLNKPLAFLNNSVWASCAGRYYIDGESLLIPRELYHYKNAASVRERIAQFSPKNNDLAFKASIDRFVAANQEHLAAITMEAMEFTRQAAKGFSEERLVISFSGGKDSTACADVVMKALELKKPVFIFGDTTLEFSQTYAYIERFKRDNPSFAFETARNDEQDFYDVCRDIGVPSRKMRWCCTMFKTGPIAEKLPQIAGNKKVVAFMGVRAAESSVRSKYERLIQGDPKIQQEVSAYSIFHWMEADVWLYIFSEQLDFNDAYRLGYNRIGCWLCPNGGLRSTFLNYVYLPEAAIWRGQLLEFAQGIGVDNVERYVDKLLWTFRQGGTGLKASEDVIVKSIGCTTEDHAQIYELNKPISDAFYSLFAPFGVVSKEHGRQMLGEVLVLEPSNMTPILSIQPFQSGDYAYTVKIKNLGEKGQYALQRKVVFQIRKYNACRNCGKCNSLCIHKAIHIKDGVYRISPECRRCGRCVSSKHIAGGCLMHRVLKPRKAA